MTQTLVAEGGGLWRAYVGGYTDWLRQRPQPAVRSRGAGGTRKAPAATRDTASPATAPPVQKSPAKRARLGYLEGRELSALPGQIEALEREQTEISARMSDPAYHAQGPERIRSDMRRLEELESELAAQYARWEALEALAAGQAGAAASALSERTP